MGRPLEIVGADELVGSDYLVDDDLEAMLGSPFPRGLQAYQRRSPGLTALRQQLAAAKAAQNATLVRDERPTESREMVIGFESLAVAAAATANVTTRPQVLFRPTRLVIPDTIGVNFTVQDVKVGNKSQLVSSGAIPAIAFSQTAFNTPLKMDTCQISMDLIIEVTNITAGPEDFRAAMFGNAVY